MKEFISTELVKPIDIKRVSFTVVVASVMIQIIAFSFMI